MQPKRNLQVAGMSTWFLCVAAGVALAAPPRVLYSTIQTSPTSDVPGYPGLKFDDDTSGFERPYRSADGQFWIMKAWLNSTVTTDDEVILRGSVLAGEVQLREGDQASWAAPGELVGPIRAKMGVNNAGFFAFGSNLAGSAPTTADEQIILHDSDFSVVAVEGGPGPAGEAYGSVLHSAGILNPVVPETAPVFWVANSTVGGLPSAQDDFVLLDGVIQAQSGIAGTPVGQIGAETWNLFDSDDCYVNADGTIVLERGTLTGVTTSNVVIALNNTVVLQESVIYPPLTAGVSTVSEALLTPEGDWFVRGETAGDVENFVIRNGVVLARKGDAVPGGLPGELFSDTVYDACFFTMAGNRFGDYVYGGVTNNADPEFDAVVVYNNETVLLRQGDGVDLNGDGLANDDAYLDIFNNEDTSLDNNNFLYFEAELRDGASTTLGQAFLRYTVPICAGDMDCNGVVDFDDINYFVVALGDAWEVPPPGACYWRAGDMDGDDLVTFDDINGFVAAIGTSCP